MATTQQQNVKSSRCSPNSQNCDCFFNTLAKTNPVACQWNWSCCMSMKLSSSSSTV